jgi:hypothetical protein
LRLNDTPTVQRVPGPRPPVSTAAAGELAASAGAHTAILVEGWSDQAAVDALAKRYGRNLLTEGIIVVPIGGVTNLPQFAQALGQRGLGLQLAGLYDFAEEQYVRRSLDQSGLGINLDRTETEALGFFACDVDLEDELIRALGTQAVMAVLDHEGELSSFRIFQHQPAQRQRDTHAQLRRFMGTRAGRKIRYGTLLVNALNIDQVPRPLHLLLTHPHVRSKQS